MTVDSVITLDNDVNCLLLEMKGSFYELDFLASFSNCLKFC